MKYLNVLFFVTVLLSACSQASNVDSVETQPVVVKQPQIVQGQNESKATTAIQSLYSDMDKLDIDLSCDTDAQCAVVGVGSMQCGGPSSYKLYSTNNSEEVINQLKQMARRSDVLEKKINSDKDLMGICQFNSPPNLICSNNQCVINSGAIIR